MITVTELIAALQKFPADAIMLFPCVGTEMHGYTDVEIKNLEYKIVCKNVDPEVSTNLLDSEGGNYLDMDRVPKRKLPDSHFIKAVSL